MSCNDIPSTFYRHIAYTQIHIAYTQIRIAYTQIHILHAHCIHITNDTLHIHCICNVGNVCAM